MKNKPRINIIKYLTRSISTLILLLALTIWIAPASAQESAHEETHAEQQNNNHAEHNATHESEHETDLGQQRAREIAVTAPPSWYHTVIIAITALFILAATLGSAALILKGPEPPDPADAHH